MNSFLSLVVSLLLVASSPISLLHTDPPPWNWSSVETETIDVPDNFLWGIAWSEYQNSGAGHCSKSNWALWEQTSAKDGLPHIVDNQQSGYACDHWNRYQTDVELMKDLGVNAARFSIEWSNIEPEEGVFDEAAFAHYEDLLDQLSAAGITPMITLHHFTDPLWFTHKGGFEKEENVHYFVRFSQKVFERLGSKVNLWCTINEPTIYMFMGYVLGKFPPGKTNPVLAMRVMKHLLQAHTQTYAALKAMPYGDTAQIGIVHQYLVFEPYRSWNVLERLPGIYFNYILNTAVLGFFKTGTFTAVPLVPDLYSLTYHAPKDQKLMDFIGLNYYSRVLIKSQFSLSDPMISSHYPDETMTDMPWAIYPDGLYKAIKEVASLGVPLYITENGIADGKDDRRELFLRRYLYSLSQAIKDGFDVRGYFYWSLMDNFEWDQGYGKDFGLYAVDRDTQERTLRESSKYYQKIIQHTKNI